MVKHVLIIAEAGVNHNGDFEMAKKLIKAAADSGADFVKFQTFKAESLTNARTPKADYQRENTAEKNETQLEMLKKLEMPVDWYPALQAYSKENEIAFLSSAFDIEGIDFLDEMGLPLFKIPSGEITNLPYLNRIAEKGKRVILSTGMADFKEIREAMNILLGSGLTKDKLTILHCNTAYPTPMEDVNLLAMNKIAELGTAVGYSDHTQGIEVPIAAVALGAEVIEKHFTLDRELPGPDHKASLEPPELKAMVSAIRNVEKAISGDGEKMPTKSELINKVFARKSLHLKHKVTGGSTIEEDNLIALRPGSGISPMYWFEVLNKKVNKDLEDFSILTWDDIQ